MLPQTLGTEKSPLAFTAVSPARGIGHLFMRSAVTSEPTSPSTDAKTPTTFIGHLAERLSDIGGAVLELTQGERRFRQVIEALPAAIYTTDAEGRITFYNQAAASLWGRHPALGELWCGSWRIYRPDGSLLPHDECP